MREQNFAKKRHTADFLRAFHTAIPQSVSDAHVEAIKAGTYVAPINKPASSNGASTSRTIAPIVSVRKATDSQKRFIASLNNQIKDLGYRISESDIESITFAEVNDTLTLLKNIIKAERDDAQKNYTNSDKVTVAPKHNEVTEGAYWYGDKIARVQKSRTSGKLYVKLETEKGSGEFEYAPGVINKLKAEDMLSVADMKAFAQAFGQCGDCGKRLTNKISIERGIGPVCSGKGYTL